MDPIKVILNPYSGRGTGASMKQALSQALSAVGVSHDLVETTHIGHGIELAYQAKLDGYDIVAAAGGDGTIS